MIFCNNTKIVDFSGIDSLEILAFLIFEERARSEK
jgi:hypothetical protein